ncbi:MAG TPA: hypothetical protein PLX97_03885 [Gemmatales bacterium]|nr:hypothetical protein [Gemmatales bacterium]
MKLLFDTDAFCKLGTANLLHDAAQIFSATLQECGRLYALPFMLRKGALRKLYGGPTCDALISVTNAMPAFPDANVTWLEKVTGVVGIDPGEAQIFALAAELAQPLVAGDKRALETLKGINEFVPVLQSRVVTLEAVLLALCDSMGEDQVRKRVSPLIGLDRMMAVCFSPDNPSPTDALSSYFRDLQATLMPLQLWKPRG